MTETDMTTPESVYAGISSLKGWDRILDKALKGGGSIGAKVGALVSDVLLAGGEDQIPLALAGELDMKGTGSLAVLHHGCVVVATASNLINGDRKTAVRLYSLRDVTEVKIEAHHNYYEHKNQARHSNLKVSVTLGGHAFTFRDRGTETALTDAAAAKSALDTLRSSLAR